MRASVTSCTCSSPGYLTETVSKSPKIEFPCAYPIKVIGVNDGNYRDSVVTVVRNYAPDLDVETVTLKDSRNGTYCSVNLTIEATGESQLKALHKALLDDPRTRLVL